jgi:hypothetical protein
MEGGVWKSFLLLTFAQNKATMPDMDTSFFMLQCLRALVDAIRKQEPEADPVFTPAGGGRGWGLNAVGYRLISQLFGDLIEGRGRAKADPVSEVIAGSYGIELRPIGDAEDPIPRLTVRRIAQGLNDFTLGPDQRALVTEVFSGFLEAGAAFRRASDGMVEAVAVLEFRPDGF